jgi:hypothetical protein
MRTTGSSALPRRETSLVIIGPSAIGTALRFPETLHGERTGVRCMYLHDVKADLGAFSDAELVLIADPLQAAWSGLLALLTTTRVPWALYLDNRTRLDVAWRIGAHDAGPGIAAAARGAVGIIADSEARAGAGVKAFGREPLVWPAVYDRSLAPPAPARRASDQPLKVAIFGGSTRGPGFAAVVGPALKQMRLERQVTVYARFDLLRYAAVGQLQPAPAHLALPDFLKFWQELRPDVVLLPPGAAQTDAAAHALLARYIGAVPIIGCDDAEDLGPAEGVLVAGREPGSWLDALRLAGDSSSSGRLLAALDASCRNAFGPSRFYQNVSEIRRWSPPAPSGEQRANRERTAGTMASQDLFARLASRCADPVGPPPALYRRAASRLVRLARRLSAFMR